MSDTTRTWHVDDESLRGWVDGTAGLARRACPSSST